MRRDQAARLRESKLTLLRRAAGSPRALFGKTARLGGVLVRYAGRDDVAARLRTLRELGIIQDEPTRTQLLAGGIDMLRFFITPAAADYYESRGIRFGFHQLLRFLDEPASLADPVGFFSTRDGIIGHLMQVVHANPLYDLELLASHDRGLDELESQLEAMLEGTHPRHGAISAIVEEPDYHARLLAYVRAWRRDPTVDPLLRENIATNQRLAERERTFGRLGSVMRYCAHLPAHPIAALIHLVSATQPVDDMENHTVG